MSNWEEVVTQQDHQTLRLKIDNGYLYQNVITWKVGDAHQVSSAMVFVPHDDCRICGEYMVKMCGSCERSEAKKYKCDHNWVQDLRLNTLRCIKCSAFKSV